MHMAVNMACPIDSGITVPLEISRIQPHNISLAKSSLDYIAGSYSESMDHFAPDPVVHVLRLSDGRYFCEDGDHRLFYFQKAGKRAYGCCLVYEISTSRGKKMLESFRADKARQSFMRDLGGHYTEHDFLTYYIGQGLDTSEETILKTIAFVRSNGIRTPADLEGRIVEYKEVLKLNFDEGFRAYRAGSTG